MPHKLKVLWKSKDSHIIYIEAWELCFLVMVSVLLLIYHVTLGKSFHYIHFRFLIIKKKKDITFLTLSKLYYVELSKYNFQKIPVWLCKPSVTPAQVRPSTQW